MTPQKFFYKITKDLLISLIITFFIMLVPELILPGIISSHFNPKYFLALIIVVGWLFAFQGRKFSAQENIKFGAISRNLLNLILFIVTVMLILSLYKMKIWQIVVVAALSIPLVIAAENMLIKEKEEGE